MFGWVVMMSLAAGVLWATAVCVAEFVRGLRK